MSDGVDATAVPLAIVTDAVAPAAAAAAPSSPQNRPITAGRFCIEKVHTIDEGERVKEVDLHTASSTLTTLEKKVNS